MELTRPKIESRDPIFFAGARARSQVSGNDRLFPPGSEFGPNPEIPASPAIQLRPRPGNACHGPHSDSVYSGSEHRQFNSPRLVKREAGFPNPRRVIIGSNQPWRVNTLRPGQNERHFPDEIFKCIFLNENVRISFKISLKFVPKGPINNIPVLVQMMAWRRPGDKPLSEQMLVSLLMHKCVTQPQWVNDPPYYRVFNPWYLTAGHNVFQDNSH